LNYLCCSLEIPCLVLGRQLMFESLGGERNDRSTRSDPARVPLPETPSPPRTPVALSAFPVFLFPPTTPLLEDIRD